MRPALYDKRAPAVLGNNKSPHSSTRMYKQPLSNSKVAQTPQRTLGLAKSQKCMIAFLPRVTSSAHFWYIDTASYS